MSPKNTGLDAQLAQYLFDVSISEPDLLRELREETNHHPQAGMQIAPEQGQLLRLLVELTGARRCIEVGVFTGYSSLSVALALPEDGLLVACDIDEVTTSIARRYWQRAGVTRKVKLELRPATETLRTLLFHGAAGSFDFAFIDADKSNYDDYYELCLQLLRKGGLIAVDNAFWGGRVTQEQFTDPDTLAIRALNVKMGTDKRVTVSLLPIGDGLFLARKR
jgi:caffeoyl-CoA O-methyltransferase